MPCRLLYIVVLPDCSKCALTAINRFRTLASFFLPIRCMHYSSRNTAYVIII